MLRTDGGYGIPGMPGNGGAYMAGNPNPLQDPRFRIQGGESPYRQPVLPTERSPEEDIPFLMPGQPQLPMAYGSSNLPNAIGNMGGIQNAQFYRGPQLGQIPPGFQGKYVS